MKVKEKDLIGIFIWVVVLLEGCGLFETPAEKNIYVFAPNMTFHSGSPPIHYGCPSEYPLACEGSQTCCQENYPYHCASEGLCYTAPPPSCPGYEACVKEPIIISSITYSKTSLKSNEKTKITISFDNSGSQENASVSEVTVYIPEINGYFEEQITEPPSQPDTIELEIGVSEEEPSSSICGCPVRGSCAPCYVKAPEYTTGLDPVITIEDSEGNRASKNAPSISITDSSSPLNCSDGSECCTYPSPGVMIDMITTPAECECPPGTVYQSTDIHYNLKICDCTAC